MKTGVAVSLGLAGGLLVAGIGVGAYALGKDDGGGGSANPKATTASGNDAKEYAVEACQAYNSVFGVGVVSREATLKAGQDARAAAALAAALDRS